MKPIKVEFQAFGPYEGYEMVDFEAVSAKGLFLICGKTGIGKTMILDAMTFALFGQSSGHGRDDFEFMRCTNADFNTDTFVKLEFENHGEYFLFERRLKRKRKNLSAEYNVSRKDENGVWQPLMENAKEKDVTGKAEEIIGLDYDQFRQVIILPQGQFEKLLTSSSDKKEEILTSIFGEDKWKEIAKHFYDETVSRKNELKAIQEKIRNSLSEENCETIGQLEEAVTTMKEQTESLDESYKKADYEKTILEQQKILAAINSFKELHKAEEKVAELKALKSVRTDWEREVNNAKRADKVRPLMDAEDTLRNGLLGRKREEAAAKDNAEEKKKAYDHAAEKVKLHTEKEKDVEELKKKRILYESKRPDYADLGEEEKKLKAKKAVAEAALTEEAAAQKAYDSFAKVIVDLNNEYIGLRDEHEKFLNAYLMGITGELASQLEEGKPCPVCGSTQHPQKAHAAENSVTKAMVDSKKKAADQKYKDLREKTAEQEKAKVLAEEKHREAEGAQREADSLKERLDNKKKNLVKGILTAAQLESEIVSLQKSIDGYKAKKQQLQDAEKEAKDAYIKSRAKIESAEKETGAAEKAHQAAEQDLMRGLKENGFDSREEAEGLMLDAAELENLSSQIIEYDANMKTAKERLKSVRAELEGREEPDEVKCQETLDAARKAKEEYIKNRAVLMKEAQRLDQKLDSLKKEGKDIDEKIREADEDFVFAKKLRGDSGTGLQRYVMGIMFSSVISAANKMLEMVHGGRYRLYRSDEKAQGSNKRGLELKVYDKNSAEHDGRFVSTLSGGEKFLASLALSIGMSTVAQKGGIKIEALFIDEGFGSLDDDSISDAMNVLNSIQKANGLVGIISHVQILQDQIPTKLLVEEDEHGSHIVQTIG